MEPCKAGGFPSLCLVMCGCSEAVCYVMIGRSTYLPSTSNGCGLVDTVHVESEVHLLEIQSASFSARRRTCSRVLRISYVIDLD